MKTRKLWDVWREGAVWMVQGPKARVHFNSRKTALEVSRRAQALAELYRKTAAMCNAHKKGGR